MDANKLQLIGLVFDLIGVIIMAISVIKIEKGFGTVDWLARVKEIAEKNKNISICGLIFIIVGFLLQCTGTIINICHAM